LGKRLGKKLLLGNSGLREGPRKANIGRVKKRGHLSSVLKRNGWGVRRLGGKTGGWNQKDHASSMRYDAMKLKGARLPDP